MLVPTLPHPIMTWYAYCVLSLQWLYYPFLYHIIMHFINLDIQNKIQKMRNILIRNEFRKEAEMTNRGLIVVVLWVAVGFVTPLSFAQTSTESGEIYNPNKVLRTPRPYDWCNERGCGYGDPNPTLPPEMKCGSCSESHSIKTEIKPSQIPSLSGADVKGLQVTPEPTPKKVTRPIVKPVISPSPLSSPSASISASPSAQPTLKPVE